MAMNLLERKRKEAELKAVEAARSQQEVRILEREEEIVRLKEAIQIQLSKEAEIKALLAGE